MLLTADEFAALPELNTTGQTVRMWIRAGMPHTLGGKTRRRMMVDAPKAVEWLAANNIKVRKMDTYANPLSKQRAEKIVESAKAIDATKDPEIPPGIEVADYTVAGLLRLPEDTLNRLKIIEETLTKRAERMKLEGTLVDLAEAKRAWTDAASACQRGLREACKLAANRVGNELRLGADAVDIVRRSMESETDQALIRLGTGWIGGVEE